MHFVHVKDQIQLTNIFETSVQNFHENLQLKNRLKSVSDSYLYQIQNTKLRFGRVNAKDEIQGCVVSVNQAVIRSAD